MAQTLHHIPVCVCGWTFLEAFNYSNTLHWHHTEGEITFWEITLSILEVTFDKRLHFWSKITFRIDFFFLKKNFISNYFYFNCLLLLIEKSDFPLASYTNFQRTKKNTRITNEMIQQMLRQQYWLTAVVATYINDSSISENGCIACDRARGKKNMMKLYTFDLICKVIKQNIASHHLTTNMMINRFDFNWIATSIRVRKWMRRCKVMPIHVPYR